MPDYQNPSLTQHAPHPNHQILAVNFTPGGNQAVQYEKSTDDGLFSTRQDETFMESGQRMASIIGRILSSRWRYF